jgi:hypothetical protein
MQSRTKSQNRPYFSRVDWREAFWGRGRRVYIPLNYCTERNGVFTLRLSEILPEGLGARI